MNILNCTPHSISIYPESAFINLVQVNPTTLIADAVDESQRIAYFGSVGNARISTNVSPYYEVYGIQFVKTEYGQFTGIPECEEDDLIIVSLPTQSMALASNHYLANRMVSPYKVVRLSSNTSTVLGCMGLSFQ